MKKWRAKIDLPNVGPTEVFEERDGSNYIKVWNICLDPNKYPNIFEPVQEPTQLEFKIGDVVRELGVLDEEFLVIADIKDNGIIKLFFPTLGSFCWHSKNHLALQKDKIAAAPALYRNAVKKIEISGRCFSSEKEALEYFCHPHIDCIQLIRWPATPTSWIIADRKDCEL